MLKINDIAYYFQPAASKFDQWACELEASEEYKQMTLGHFKRSHSSCQEGVSARDAFVICVTPQELVFIMNSGDKTEFVAKLKKLVFSRHVRIFSRRDTFNLPGRQGRAG